MRTRFLAIMASALATIIVAGCGGGGSSTATAGKPTRSAVGGNSFQKYEKSKKIVAFGTEAPVAEREAASAVLSENLAARAAADFASQCGSLGAAALEVVLGSGANGLTSQAECTKGLQKMAEPLKSSKGVRTDTLSGSISALRMDGDKAYALFHGNDGHGYAMPMEKENGEWRVGALVLIPLH